MGKMRNKPDLGEIMKDLKPSFPSLTIDKLKDYLGGIDKPYKTIGGNNSRRIRNLVESHEILQTDSFTEVVPSVGLIPMIGSGILIKSTIFLTAGHCARRIDSVISDGRQVMMQFNYQSLLNQTSVDLPNVIYYSVKKVLEIGDGLDYGLLRVGALKKTKKVAPVDKTTLKNIPIALDIGSNIVVVGHPAGSPKKGSPGKIVSVNGDIINHDADTLAISSGSPIFLMETGKLIGIQTSKGDELENYNVGIKMLAIYNATNLIKKPK